MSQPIASPTAALRQLVELLATDASAEQYTAVAARARAAGVGERDLREIDQAVTTALGVRQVLRRQRRREAELTALFDTASDLAALRDLDAVLHSIVRRARSLLGTDTAYLTLVDEAAQDTVMRVTDGSVSLAFQQLRLQLGEGLGGLVAQTMRPYASPDYRTDERFQHTESIDHGVLDEGLVAILGVPLLLGSGPAGDRKVIGVLFAADRGPRSFRPDEVALLGSLAAHAAIAIDTAKALAEAEAAAAELTEANAVIQENAAATQRAAEAHDRLTDLVLRGSDVSEVAAAVAEFLGGRLMIFDPRGDALAEAGGAAGAAPPDTEVLLAAVDRARAEGRSVRDGEWWHCAVLTGQELLGSLAFQGRPDLEGPDRRLFERTGTITALLLLLRRTVAETENRVRGELLTDLLDGSGRDPELLVERGHRLGVDLTRPHLVLVAEAEAEPDGRLTAGAQQYLFGREGLCCEYEQHVVMLLPDDGTEPGRAARAASEHLAHGLGAPVSVVAAGPCRTPGALPGCYAEGRRCLSALHVLGLTGDGACAADLGFLGVLLGREQDTAGFVDRVLGPVLEWDERRGTELIRTLQAYFAAGGSHVRAKDMLHVHVNTVVQRIDRIAALLGRDWERPDRALEIQLALRIHLVSRAGRGGGRHDDAPRP
ncbi:helix-turn-helix domain-containing protein [Streptomyces beihaiensis]|uniref:Helix-turn-helix domain-containing protein n=1 Tax=Streptomyces beihaiensis TaxID=2984495 RepID=A0ABT3TVX9_9ACTN|nr:GAF domain-containing protein [Streptomyces beihaiensis]MCX3061219.1 helix-turn-helix domain-containing protein [Streptomyces beihaiensis]